RSLALSVLEQRRVVDARALARAEREVVERHALAPRARHLVLDLREPLVARERLLLQSLGEPLVVAREVARPAAQALPRARVDQLTKDRAHVLRRRLAAGLHPEHPQPVAVPDTGSLAVVRRRQHVRRAVVLQARPSLLLAGGEI